jgi:predicted TIM-barrel fold metal-dependent hydrolase
MVDTREALMIIWPYIKGEVGMHNLSEQSGGSFDIRRIESRGLVQSERPLTVISSDSHVALPREDYIDYLDPKYRSYGREYLDGLKAHDEAIDRIGYPVKGDVLKAIDERNAIRSGGEIGAFDPSRRLRETEAEGVVAEFLHPGGPLSTPPFFGSPSPVASPELRAAGARAHNRFLSEFCRLAPNRLLGVHLIYPWPDMAAAVKDCVLAAESGAKAVFPPQSAGAPGDPSPPVYDRFYDPFWAVCQDLGLVVHIHAGWGRAQGTLQGDMDKFSQLADEAASSVLAEALDTFVERRALWQLMWGGVFDRYPHLKISFVEIHCDWVPWTLAQLDKYAAETPMKLKPSEYWERHCAIGGSCLRYGDVAARNALGIEELMFWHGLPPNVPGGVNAARASV